MKIAKNNFFYLSRTIFENLKKIQSIFRNFYQMNSKKSASSKIKKQKSVGKKTTKTQKLRSRSSTKNKFAVRKSKRLIEKQKNKNKNSQQILQAQNQTQPQKNDTQNPLENSKIKSNAKKTIKVSKSKSPKKKQNPICKQKKQYKTRSKIRIEKQKNQEQIIEEKDEKTQFLYNNCFAYRIQFPQRFQHQYISSTTPIASDIRNNFTHIHSHTDRTQRNHSQLATYYQYHITFQLLSNQNAIDQDLLNQDMQQIENQIENQIDESHNILIRIGWRNLQDSQVFNLRRQADKKGRKNKIGEKQKYNKNNGQKQKQRKKSFDGLIIKVLNSKHVPEFIEQQDKQVIDPLQINRSAFKPVSTINQQNQGVIKLFYFLFQNKQKITVGRSVRYERGRALRQISYLKIDPHISQLENEDQKGFFCKQTVYISFDFQKDHTSSSFQNNPKFKEQKTPSQQRQNSQKQNWKIGMIEFDPLIPKRIFRKIVSTQYLRAQFYVNQITVESKRSNAKSILENDISTRHPINFGELFKYTRKIKVEKAFMKRGAQIFLRQINVKLTFTKLQILRIGDLEILQPLQFVQFQCLESLQFEGKFMHNLRSLKKLNLKQPLQKISLNKSLSLLQRLVIIQQRAAFNDYQHTASHLRSLTEMNFDSHIIYENPQDKMIPMQLAAKMGLQNVFKRGDHHMLPSFAEYNEVYLKQYQVHELVNEILGVLNRRMF